MAFVEIEEFMSRIQEVEEAKPMARGEFIKQYWAYCKENGKISKQEFKEKYWKVKPSVDGEALQ